MVPKSCRGDRAALIQLARATAAMEGTQRGGKCHPGKEQALQTGLVAPPPPLCKGFMGAWATCGQLHHSKNSAGIGSPN